MFYYLSSTKLAYSDRGHHWLRYTLSILKKIMGVGNLMNVLTFSIKKGSLRQGNNLNLIAGSTKISCNTEQDLVSVEVNIAV